MQSKPNWLGGFYNGRRGIFPADYVQINGKIVDQKETAGPRKSSKHKVPRRVLTPPPGPTAKATFEFEGIAADNELSFPKGAIIFGVVSNQFQCKNVPR